MTEHHEDYVAHHEMARLAQRIVELERRLKRVASAQGDLRHSAIDHGASIPIKDAEGNVTAVLGGHDEPLHYVGGPDPVQPEPPFVDTGGENVKIQHSGFDINNDRAPSDFRRARIYVSRETGFEPGPESFAAYMVEADGSVTHRLPGGEWYVGVVWETRSGKLSPMSETVLADVAPLVDTDDIQEVLDEATERIDEAQQIAEGRFETLETGFEEHDTRITEATDRLTTAEGILAPIPERLTAAETKAETAQRDATAAAAAAIEANNRALTRLYNGNFDRELDGWTVDNVTVSTDAHSGLYAARFENASWMWAETALPVRPGQIWELSMYTKGTADRLGIDVWVEDEFGEYLETFETFNIRPTGEWSDSGGLRFEIPDDAGGLNFTLSLWRQEDSVWLIDDIVLRDVTDVVRLEEAATANRQAAEAALAEAQLIRYAVEGEDGESGLKGELREARVLSNAAQARADEAHANAGAAWTHADAAMTRAGEAETSAKDHADNLPKVLHGTTAPSGTAPNGSIWWRHQGTLSGPVIGQWNRVNGSWQSTPIDSQAIANLDVGKLTAGSSEIAEAVIDLLWARVVRAGLLEADEALIGGTLLEDGAVTAEKITATREMITKLFAAEWAYVAERLVVDGEIIAANATVINAAMQNLTVAERLDFVQAFGDEIYSKQAITNVLTAGEAWIGGALIKDNTIDVENLNVTQEMVGEFAKFMHLVVDQMDVNALWADTAWLTAVEAASVRLRSSIDSWETLISGRGLEVISPEGQPSTQLGNFEENGLTLYRDGEATASVTDDGSISGKVLSANEEFFYQGTELTELLGAESELPRGVVSKNRFNTTRGPYYNETGVGYVGFLAEPGREYRITATGVVMASSAGGYIHVRMRAAMSASEDAGWPTPSIAQDAAVQGAPAYVRNHNNTGYVTFNHTWFWSPPSDTTGALKPTRMLLTLEPSASASGATWGPGGQIAVEDIGPTPPWHAAWHDGGSGGGAPPPTLEPVKSRRVSTWNMSWWRTWWQNGNIPSSGVGVKEAVQGRSPYFTTAGTYRSMIGFPSMTSDLSGADIEKIEVRVRVIHSHSSSGGNVRLGTHSNSSRPSSYTGTSNAESTNTLFGRGQEKWVTLPSSLYNGFKNGSYRGVTMFTSSTSSTYYVQANPSRFAIRVTYRK